MDADAQRVMHPAVVRTAINHEHNMLCEYEWEYGSANMRHAAYRQFVYHIAGNTGKNRRLVIPSCVTWFIRSKWPSEDNNYRGFKKAACAQARVLHWTIESGVQLAASGHGSRAATGHGSRSAVGRGGHDAEEQEENVEVEEEEEQEEEDF
jgi:hypothetical protein